MTTLFHVSSLPPLAPGVEVVLRPGPQGAEGPGVYFSAGAPRFSAAEGCRAGIGCVIALQVDAPAGWWRTKPGIARKHGRPITWHSDGKAVSVRCLQVDAAGVCWCAWEWTCAADVRGEADMHRLETAPLQLPIAIAREAESRG